MVVAVAAVMVVVVVAIAVVMVVAVVAVLVAVLVTVVPIRKGLPRGPTNLQFLVVFGRYRHQGRVAVRTLGAHEKGSQGGLPNH